MRIISLAAKRLAASLPTLLLILVGIFCLLQFAPGDTVDAMLAQMGGGDAAIAPLLAIEGDGEIGDRGCCGVAEGDSKPTGYTRGH
jgi:ABC-type microcin C transport system permease subunit YejB